jgi:hypothetical protein
MWYARFSTGSATRSLVVPGSDAALFDRLWPPILMKRCQNAVSWSRMSRREQWGRKKQSSAAVQQLHPQRRLRFRLKPVLPHQVAHHGSRIARKQGAPSVHMCYGCHSGLRWCGREYASEGSGAFNASRIRVAGRHNCRMFSALCVPKRYQPGRTKRHAKTHCLHTEITPVAKMRLAAIAP